MTTDDACFTCKKPHPWPDGTTPRHPFTTENGPQILPVNEDKKPQMVAVRHSPHPFDPVLRLALINAGVLTVDDLVVAEKQMHAVTFSGVSGAS